MPKPEPGTPGYKRRMADHADTGFTRNNWWGMDAPCKGGHHVGPILNRRYWEDFNTWIGECDACGSTVNPDQVEDLMFDSLYSPYHREIEAFGNAWCGPDHLPHAEWTHCADYPKDPEDGDGQPVKVYVAAWPARFYKLVVGDADNSVGDPRDGFTLSTGSGMDQWAADTAVAISRGLVGLDE